MDAALNPYLPILIMLTGATVVAAAILILNAFLGRKMRTQRKLSPVESGMPLLDENRKRISIKFYLIALVFILFDIEAAFLYPWAVVFRAGVTEGAAVLLFVEMMVFLAVLFVGYVYIWKKGALDWQ